MNRFDRGKEHLAVLDRKSKTPVARRRVPVRINRFKPYWRLDDPVCREFLRLGTDPTDFESVKLLFTCVREFSVLEVPRDDSGSAADWLAIGFVAAHDLGCKRPELLEAILPGEEVRLASQRLRIIEKLSEERRLTHKGLEKSFRMVVRERMLPKAETLADPVLAEMMLKSLRAGFAAATVALFDPAHSEFLAHLGRPMGCPYPDLVDRALMSSLWRAHEERGRAPRHPLLRLARGLYPDGSLESRTVLRFLNEHLRELNVNNESECPTEQLDLVDWIAAGLRYGYRLAEERPRLVSRVFAECAGPRLEDARSVVRKVVEEAGRIDPFALLAPLERWKSDTFPRAATFYGNRMARVACFVDFVIWIAWFDSEVRGRNQLRSKRKRKTA